jgi:hypothetical protein
LQQGILIKCKDIHKYEGGRIKANLDIEIAVDIMLLSENLDVVVLVSGDGDFVRLVEAIQMKGVRCEVIGFGISTSNELIEAADHFTEIGSLPGIFRNAPSGPGAHLRAPQGAPGDQRGVYTYSSVSYSATYALPSEHLSGEKERERLRAIQGERLSSPSFWQDREQRQHPQSEQNGHILQSGSENNGQSTGYDFATHDEFMLPDGEPCSDLHSIPLARPITHLNAAPNDE